MAGKAGNLGEMVSLLCEKVSIPMLGSGLHVKASWGLEAWLVEPDEVVLAGERFEKSDLDVVPFVYLERKKGCSGRDKLSVMAGVPLVMFGMMAQAEADEFTEELMRNAAVVNRGFLSEYYNAESAIAHEQKYRHRFERLGRWAYRGLLQGVVLAGAGVYYLANGMSPEAGRDVLYTLAVAMPCVEVLMRVCERRGRSCLDGLQERVQEYQAMLQEPVSQWCIEEIRKRVEWEVRKRGCAVGVVYDRSSEQDDLFEQGVVMARMFLGLEKPVQYDAKRLGREWKSLVMEYKGQAKQDGS